MRIIWAWVGLGVLAFGLSRPVGAQDLDEARRLIQAGETRAAAEAFAQVAAQSLDPTEQATGHNNACVLWIRLGDYAAAWEACRQALPLRRQLGDRRRLARGLNNSGLALQHLGRYEDAMVHYGEALEINRQRQDWHSVVINLSNLGWLETTVGRYEDASRHLAEAVRLAEAWHQEPWADEQLGVARLNYGVLLEKIGAFREALDLYETLLADPSDLGGALEAQLEVNRGVMLRNLGDPIRARQAFEEAIQVFATVEDPAGLSNAWLNLGLVYLLNLQQLEPAESAFLNALAKARESGDLGEEVQDLYFLARLRIEQGRLEDAKRVLEDCRQVAGASGSVEGQWLAEDGLGRLARAQGELETALRSFSAAMERIESTRRTLGEDDWGTTFLEDKRSVYVAAVETAVELALRDGDPDIVQRAWDLVQRAKARQLLEAVGQDADPETLAPATSSLDALTQEIGEAALLDLFVGETRLYGWTLAGGELQLHDLGELAPLRAAARRVYFALARGGAPVADDLATLSSALLASTGAMDGAVNHLYIAADGELRRLPFELLHSRGRPVIDQVSVSYLPSASMLLPLRQRFHDPPPGSQATGPRVLAMGDPILPVNEEPLPGPADLLRQRFQLRRLPASVEELGTVEGYLGGPAQLFLGEQANETAFRSWAPQTSAVLHLATHSLVDDGIGGSSAIVLSPGGDDDGMLFPREIAQLRLQAPLTVLASCRSALGDGDGNGALNSLSGAFLTAGTSAVVASLWEIDDQASQVFMEQFYYQLSRRRSPQEALRLAKLRLRKDPRWNRPDVWAAFVLIGDAPALVERSWAAAAVRWLVPVFITLIWLSYRRLRRVT